MANVQDKVWLPELSWKLSFIAFGACGITREEGDIYGRVHVFLHIGSVLCLAALLTLNLSLSLPLPPLIPHALTNRAVCQLLQVAPSNKWSWVRADNTGHVDLVNLTRGNSSKRIPLRYTRFAART